jgi:hypothetical protein
MAKKQKKQRSSSMRSKQKNLCRKLDWACLVLGLAILVSAIGTAGSDYDLSKANPQGFAMWFLLITGWIPLEILGVIRWLFGLHQEISPAGEGPTLGLCALTALAAVWALFRFHIAKTCRPEVLRAAFHFILIFACWGLFQLVCCIIALSSEHSDIAPLDKTLTRQLSFPREKKVGQRKAE